MFHNGTYPFFRTADAGRVRFGELLESADYLNEAGIKGLRLVPRGTILFPKSGASTFLNHRVILGVDGYVASHLATILADPRVLDERFLLYYLATVSAQDLVQDNNYPSLNLSIISAIHVPVPPLPEQRRISAILDQSLDSLDRVRTNTEKNIENCKRLFDAQLSALLSGQRDGWSEKTLAQVALDMGRGKSKHRPRNDPSLYGGPHPFIQTGDVRGADHVITSFSQTYNDVGLSQSKLWPKGTLCITIAANIAETGILDFAACFPDSVIGVVVDKNQTSNKFLEYLLQSFKIMLQAQGKGAAQDNINLGTFEKQTFPFPDLKRQEAIVKALDSIREDSALLSSGYEQKLESVDALKSTILRYAFSGQL